MSTAYFPSAHDFQIQNLTIQHQTVVASKAFDHLHSNIAADALYNSDERCDAPKCHPETRKAVQQDIRSWIGYGDDDEEPTKILWLSGPAGSGKTAIARSIAEICDDEEILAGSFFFSSFAGSDSRRTKRCLIATLAYCLLQHDALQPLRATILSAIERDPSIFRKNMNGQCKSLLMKPFQVAARQLDSSSIPKVIIIDGLDEAEAPDSRQLEAHEARRSNEKEQVEILSSLLQAVQSPHFPFRIVVVSRPEPAIRNFFSTSANHISNEVFLDDKYDPIADIDLFLRAKFSDIRRRYRLSPSWPGEDVFEALRRDSSGQFIYAATVVRFLETAKGHPQARLDDLLTNNRDYRSVNVKVLSPLDALYTHVLTSSPDPESSVRWLGAIHYLRPNKEPALFIRQLLQEHEGEAEYLLEHLASLVHIPPLEDDISPFAFHHKSLLDFLDDAERCGHTLHAAFREGPNALLYTRLCHVVEAKSPIPPLDHSAWQAFLPSFLRALENQMELVSASDVWEEAFASCDVLWWVRTVDAIFFDDPVVSQERMRTLFDIIHKRCDRMHFSESGEFVRCRRSCRHWRGNIWGACKALGWRVPNSIALLRERITAVSENDFFRTYSLDVHFGPPDPSTRCSARPTLPSRSEPVSLESYDDEYESMCRLSESMFKLLPADWEERLYKEAGVRKHGELDYYQAYACLRSEIGEVCRQLGVDIEDVDVTNLR